MGKGGDSSFSSKIGERFIFRGRGLKCKGCGGGDIAPSITNTNTDQMVVTLLIVEMKKVVN